MDATIASHSDLFQPAQLGQLALTNRIIMAPLTRSRAGKGDIQGQWQHSKPSGLPIVLVFAYPPLEEEQK